MAKTKTTESAVQISKGAGRPMLSWVGKHVPAGIRAYPAQEVERFGDEAAPSSVWGSWPKGVRRGGLLYHGDNTDVLAQLLVSGFRATVDLIYIDPPFDSGADYVRKVQLRGAKGQVKLEGEPYSLGEQVQYTDIWANDNYLQFMFERLLLMKELMAPESFIVVHCDWKKSHQLRCIMDEVFGEDAFQNEIYWHFYNKMHDDRKGIIPRATNTLLVYRKGSVKVNKLSEPRERVVRQLKRVKVNGVLQNLKDESGNLVYQDSEDRTIDNIWSIPLIPPADVKQKTDYPTQKPEALLEMVLHAYSKPGALVLDAFVGSGTTAVVAQKLGRRWIGCDINKGAIQTTMKRLVSAIENQSVSASTETLEFELGNEIEPVQAGFTHLKVNDYDLAIQHNEAVQLVRDYLGFQRLASDSYFDGVYQRQLVKVIPFTHALSPVDLQTLAAELETRPTEDRGIAVVCLGKELAADTWLSDWNRLRKGSSSVNRIEVIELRSDTKHGGFLTHQPPEAIVTNNQVGRTMTVQILDFISPTILQRLAQQSGVLQPVVSDWRWMVDSVMIDPEYDGDTFRIVETDFPVKRTDLVTGQYDVSLPDGSGIVAVKITDMLGEESLVEIPYDR